MSVSFVEAYNAAREDYSEEEWWNLTPSERVRIIYCEMRRLDLGTQPESIAPESRAMAA
ncbi:MAG: hypothetical protein AB7F89_14795 [Pirellulaceae bacterium]